MSSLLEPRPTPAPYPIPALLNPPATPSRSRRLIPLLLILFTIAMALTSNGFLEADETNHFLKARAVWDDWLGLIDIWGRLGCTALYSLAAPFGIITARLLSALITTCVALGATLLIRHFLPRNAAANAPWTRRHAVALTWLFLFAQPFFTLNSFTVMTEMLLALSWVWTLVALIHFRLRPGKGIILASLLLGAGGLMRPEGWIAIACWPAFAALWLHLDTSDSATPNTTRRASLILQTLLAALVAAAPTLMWYLLGVAGLGDWLWPKHHWPWAATSQYGRTGAQFAIAVVVSMAVWLWIPITIALLSLLKKWRSPRHTHALLLLAVPLFGLYLLHGILGSFGLFGSMSLPRYFISVAPMAAVLAVLGLSSIEAHLNSPRALHALVAALSLFTLTTLLALGYLPSRKNLEEKRLDVVAAEIERTIPTAQIPFRIISGHPYLALRLNLPENSPANTRAYADAIRQAPLGTVVITDSMLWYYEHRPSPEQLASWGYILDQHVADLVDAETLRTQPQALNWAPGKVRLWTRTSIPTTTPSP